MKTRQRMTCRSASTKRISKERDSEVCENSERIPNGISGLTALELPALVLVCLFQLLRSCVQTRKQTRTLPARGKQKGVESFCIRRKVYLMHAVRWRRKVSGCKRSLKALLFIMLIARTEAMEAHGSPGSIGATDIPVPDDAGLGGQADDLGMTPTTDILTQLVYNNRVTTNAISHLATHSGSTGVPNSYEGTLSEALEGAVKMLGRPPNFGGGKTEVHDFLDFKEQLYNILAYAEPKYTEAFKNFAALDNRMLYLRRLPQLNIRLCRPSCILC